jgi:hypothetical protein
MVQKVVWKLCAEAVFTARSICLLTTMEQQQKGHELKPRTWAASQVEEVISALWLIAGLLAWSAGIKWFAWILFVKAALDVLCAWVFVVKEIKEERK